MELSKVLYMKGGNDEASYGQTAHVAKRAISMTTSARKEAMAEFCKQHFPINTICIADLGCASGPNTLTAVSELILVCEEVKRQQCMTNDEELEYQILLNDLPGNDFNSVFRSLPVSDLDLDRCYVAGVPGSFHGRLFPARTLHFVHASYCLQWLSQLPECRLLAGNKCNIYLANSSPESVIQAYQDQFQKDINSFLESRAREVINGGRMVLTFCSRITDDPTEECYGLGALAFVLNQLVDEGKIKQEDLEAFNMPVYHASAREIKQAVEKEGSFYVNSLEIVEGKLLEGQEPTSEVKAVLESLFASQFGDQVIDEIFNRFDQNIKVAILEQTIFFPHVTISLTRK